MGSYVADSLGPDEVVRYAARKSLWRYWLQFLVGAGLLLGAGAARHTTWAWGSLLAAAVVALLWPYLARRTTELVLTDRRAIAKFGLLTTSAVEIRLDKVESVRVTQGLLGRLLNYGDIVITGTGSTHDPIRDIASPMAFRSALNAAIEVRKPAG